jgi:hypothetical protein
MYNKEIKIIDNFLNNTEALMVQTALENANWNLSFYQATVAPHKYLEVINNNKNIKEYIQFYHSFLDDLGNAQNSPLGYLIIFMQEKIKEIFKVNRFLRMKANLLTQCSFSNDDFYNTPHLDRTDGEKFFTAIYYVNNSDGDTFFFDKVNNEFIISKRVEPKKGRLIIFDGNIYHTGRHPKNSFKRIVINFNFN